MMELMLYLKDIVKGKVSMEMYLHLVEACVICVNYKNSLLSKEEFSELFNNKQYEEKVVNLLCKLGYIRVDNNFIYFDHGFNELLRKADTHYANRYGHVITVF